MMMFLNFRLSTGFFDSLPNLGKGIVILLLIIFVFAKISRYEDS